MPVAEIDIDTDVVRALLAEQHPDLHHLVLEPVAFGWDNVLFRLGSDLGVRLPRRQVAAELIESEQRWLPQLAPRLPLPVPVPLRVGRPGPAYPWAWSVTRWIEGHDLADGPGADAIGVARQLGEFLAALHTPAPVDAPSNPYRGVPLANRDEGTEQRIDQLAGMIDARAVRERWRALVATPAWAGPSVWLHGDLHPANILAADGQVTAVIDFGDITAGDPATDLGLAWMLLPRTARATFRVAAGSVDDATWTRAQGWALSLALAYLANSANNARVAAIGHRTLAAVLADEPGAT